ncbi:hypothetical protein [uncultured Adlercreutzia sp.]|uniref:hypothetical protein n=1 Tax=uncultured Adlercreutzia sp. TaxID=875803 RepID=UPI0025FB7E03|nr:hypothetical protein [uncultured Adlercreutzia sp.]MCI9260993.1 hypothetical protein [Eggerthellaceae bacterium]
MPTVKDGHLVFGRDQIVSASQAAKNFGEIRRRALLQPQYISDRNAAIDAVLVNFDTFEELAVENERLKEELLYERAAHRISQADADPNHRSIPLEEVMSPEEYQGFLAIDTESVSDEELFE